MLHRSRSAFIVGLLYSGTALASGGQEAPARPSAGATPSRGVTPIRVPPARFADPDRMAKLARAFPDIDQAFLDYAQRSKVPGLGWGVIIDGTLAHSGAMGVRDTATNTKVHPDSVFRIASMTKSFTALAIMKLRDQGRLSLDTPVSTYVPELKSLRYPTTDSPAITIRHLLTHTGGFPEDNPWGDRQLAESEETFSRWMEAGFPFSQAPGMAFEYSNTGFAILGRVIARVSGMRARDYIDREILMPLRLNNTKWEASSVQSDRVAAGHRRTEETWAPEVPLADGSYGVMGGLYSSVPDLAKVVALYLSAYPPRDGEDAGPVKRASLREMQTPHSPYRSTALRSPLTTPISLSAGGYAFGLGATQSCRFAHVVSHSGGLPGYGSLMRWLPEYGVGVVALANATYAGPGRPVNEALEALARTGGLKSRLPEGGAELLAKKAAVDGLVNDWSDAGLQKIASMNLLLDRSLQERRKDFETLRTQHGSCRADSGIEAENALRGKWALNCERGRVLVRITLAPTLPPTIQDLETTSVLPPSEALSKATGALLRSINQGDSLTESLLSPSAPSDVRAQLEAARRYGACVQGDVLSGGGDDGTLELNCALGSLQMRVAVDQTSRLTALRIAPAPGSVCVP